MAFSNASTLPPAGRPNRLWCRTVPLGPHSPFRRTVPLGPHSPFRRTSSPRPQPEVHRSRANRPERAVLDRAGRPAPAHRWVNYRPLSWISLCGSTRISHRHLQAEKDPAPAVLRHLVHRLSPDSFFAVRAIPTAEATGGRCPTLERLEFGLLNRRPSFRAPEWVEINFRSFSLGGKGLEPGHIGGTGIQAPPTTPPPCHVTGPRPSSYEDRSAGAIPARLAVWPQQT